MKTRFFLLAAVLSLASGVCDTAFAGSDKELRNIADSIRLYSNGKIRIYTTAETEAIAMQDTVSTTERSELTANGEHTSVRLRSGYRIQVYSDNKGQSAKTRAQGIAANISHTFPHYGTYLAYKAPYWRLRIGDFHSEEQAKEALTELKSAFPSLANEMRIVRDRIKYLE